MSDPLLNETKAFYMKKWILPLSILIFPIGLIAQHQLSGKVINTEGHPLSNVLVKVKNLKLQTSTNKNGNFEIFVPPNQKILLTKEGYKKATFLPKKTTNQLVEIVLNQKASSQSTVTLKGKVLDAASREPLIGASVLVSNTKLGTITDLAGYFELEVPKNAEIEIPINCFGPIPRYKVTQSIYKEFLVNQTSISDNQFITKLTVAASNFNQGNIHHPLQLIQGKVPGLMNSSSGGNNPFGRYHNRLRGLSTFSGENRHNQFINTAEPLLVVDGLPFANIDLLDPLSITSMKIIKDGTAAQYGMRGASGVIEISTNQFQENGIQYHTYLGIDKPWETMTFLNAKAYRNTPGHNDLGDATDWMDEVSRTAISQVHHLSLSNQFNNTKYQLSSNYRMANGVLKNQGFDRLQFSANFQQKAFDNRLQLNATIRSSTQDNNFSEPLAFRYAQVYNPTAPILAENNEFGGYFQQILFDYYNPVAMLEQTKHKGKQSNLFTFLSAELDLLKTVSLAAKYGYENQQNLTSYYVDKNSFWVGRNRNGWASQNKSQQNNQFVDAFVKFEPQFGALQGQIKVGYQKQTINRSGLSTQAGDFLTDAFSFNNLSAASDYTNGRGIVNSFQNKHQLAAYYLQAQFNWNNSILINTGWRMENASRLGSNIGLGNFPYVALQADMGNLLSKFWSNNSILLRGSFGITGQQPYNDYLALRRYNQSYPMFYNNGEYIYPYGVQYDENPDLKWEEKKEWNLGFDVQPMLMGKRIAISLDYYQNKTSDIIRPNLVNDLGRDYFGNIAGLKNTGVEATIRMPLIEKNNFSWHTEMIWSTNKTILTKYNDNPNFVQTERGPAGVQAGGCCKVSSVLYKKDAEIGTFWMLDALGITADGRWQFADADGNGIADDIRDKTNIGNGLPNWLLGWNNDFSLGNLSLNLFFRGAFGHDNFNITRKLAENPVVISAYNVMPSAFKGDAARLTDSPQESSYYLEKASFLRLDNATLRYTFDLSNHRYLTNLQVYFTGQNLLTITRYSGWDTDYILQTNEDVFAIGYENRAIYLPTKSYTFGIKLGIK